MDNGGACYGPLEVSRPLGTTRLKKRLNADWQSRTAPHNQSERHALASPPATAPPDTRAALRQGVFDPSASPHKVVVSPPCKGVISISIKEEHACNDCN
jgi:hypothetical protein